MTDLEPYEERCREILRMEKKFRETGDDAGVRMCYNMYDSAIAALVRVQMANEEEERRLGYYDSH